MSLRSAAFAPFFLCALASPSLLAAQDEKRKEGEGKKAQEDFPKWTVHGVLATDYSALWAPAHNRGTMPDRGIAGEYALGAGLDLNRSLHLAVRACAGCHGFQLHSAYADYDLADALSVRAGRLPVPFGGLSRRTSPAQVESSSKPLPYIMGWMVRRNEFNLGIVPAPIVDNGAEVLGNVWVTEGLQVGYEAAVFTGLKGTTPDIDFALSRDFRDNNGEPAGAARVTLAAGPLALGLSGMYGRYDPDHELSYRLAEADVGVHGGDWNLRLEGVARETDFIDSALDKDRSLRAGYVAQFDLSLDDRWRVFLLQDGLTVRKLFLSPVGPQPAPGPGTTGDVNRILRFVGGAIFALRPGVLLKASAEYWDFSSFKDTWVFHLEFVVEF